LYDSFGPQGTISNFLSALGQLGPSEFISRALAINDEAGDLGVDFAVLTIGGELAVESEFNNWIVNGYFNSGAPDEKGCLRTFLVRHDGTTRFVDGEEITYNLPTSETASNAYLHRVWVDARSGGKDRMNFELECAPDGSAEISTTPRDNNHLLQNARGGVYASTDG
jgi:hypothetical protein